MKQRNILVVEDEPDIADLIALHLRDEGFSVTVARDGNEGMRHAFSRNWDLVLLDIRLPGPDGLSICRALRAEQNYVPILMLTSKSSELDRVLGLELGADDYVPKPFSPSILLARVRAVLRRSKQAVEEGGLKINIDGLSIDSKKFQLSIDDVPEKLTKSEFGILYFLASHRGWVFTRYQIVNAIRGEQYVVTERAIDVQIAGLRKKLGVYAALIETVRGVGYRFKE